jgi:hypothetical protein
MLILKQAKLGKWLRSTSENILTFRKYPEITRKEKL